MAIDIFARIGDIKGESLDDKHKDEIEVLSWSWGLSQTGSTAPGSGGGGAGKASFSDFRFTHHIDKASPLLMKACATGMHIKDATITARKPGAERQEYLIFKMEDIQITGVQPALNSGESGVENVSLQAAKVDFEYKPQNPDGSFGTDVHFRYDIKLNKEG